MSPTRGEWPTGWSNSCALKNFLKRRLDYDMVSEHLARELTKILQDNLPEDQADSAHILAQQCARRESHAVDAVNKILTPPTTA
jgi:hypothetical protein